MKVCTQPIERQGKEPPQMRVTHQDNPLLHKDSFSPGDSIKVLHAAIGLTVGLEYPILGYWHREKEHMYVYLDNSPIGHLKHFRSAVEEGKDHEEVLFCQLPDVITEICIQDNLQKTKGGLFGMEYVPAMGPEVVMRRTLGGLNEACPEEKVPQEAQVIQMNSKGQLHFPFYLTA